MKELFRLSKSRRNAHWILLALPLAAMSVGFEPSRPAAGVPMKMGTHWAEPSDFATLRRLGYTFAIVTVPADDPTQWAATLEAAAREGLELVIGVWPNPYHLRSNGSWRIDDAGVDFLLYLKAHPQQIMAVWGFNEPYWTKQDNDVTYPCGFYSAKDLRRLRTAIRNIWPSAKVYHDLDMPSTWAPGGTWWQENSCIGNKYADQTLITDYAGIWSYPFDTERGYTRQASLDLIANEVQFVKAHMAPAKPVVLGQAFSSSDGQYFPTPSELQDWSCSLRSLGVETVSWYAWRQDLYPDDLAHHPAHWQATVPWPCAIRSGHGCYSPIEEGGR